MSREWPPALKSYVRPANAAVFTPERWISGQLTVLILGCVCFVVGVIALAVSPHERLFGVVFAIAGALAALFPIRDRLMWVRVETTDAGIDVTSGWWRFARTHRHIDYRDVQTVRLQSDEKAYGYRLPNFKFVVIEPVSVPFVGDPPGIPIGEMFGLQVPVLEALRDELAARAGRNPVASVP